MVRMTGMPMITGREGIGDFQEVWYASEGRSRELACMRRRSRHGRLCMEYNRNLYLDSASMKSRVVELGSRKASFTTAL
jgi:hypothetical protein